jgi:hypothetical protein
MSASDQLLARTYARARARLEQRRQAETGSLWPAEPYGPPLVQGRRALHNRGLAWAPETGFHGYAHQPHQPAPAHPYDTRRGLYETGQAPWADLGGLIGSEVMVPAVITALQDPKTQAQIERTMVTALESPDTKRALRPYVIEAAVWATIAITLGGFAWRWITK